MIPVRGNQGTGDARVESEVERPAVPSERAPSVGLLEDLRALVLLGGRLRQSPFARAVGRSLCDLPLDRDRTILQHWHEQLSTLAREGRAQPSLRLILDPSSASPREPSRAAGTRISFERERSPLRGTAGILKDATEAYSPHDYVLVGNASHVLLQPLTRIIRALARSRPEAAVLAHDDGTPGGLLLLRCSVLQCVPSVGYVDLKEQAIPRITTSHAVRVVRRQTCCGLPVRTPSEYLHALRIHHQLAIDGACHELPYTESCQRVFSVCEEGARVGRDSHLHDSVVLQGGTVESGASVFRSIVCPGAVVRRGRCVIDEVVR